MAQCYGVTIREARNRQGLSQARLADLAGISRRHLASLETGANVSVEVLTAVTRVLGITDIDLGDGLTAHDASANVAAARLLALGDEIAREGERLMLFGNNLQAFVSPGPGRPIPKDTPTGGAVSDLAAELVNLSRSAVA